MPILDGANIDNLRRMVERGGDLRAVQLDAVRLGAAFELACAAAGGPPELKRAVEQWSRTHDVLLRACRALDGGHDDVSMWSWPEMEIAAGPESGDEMATKWGLHRDRFGRSLQRRLRLPGALARAITGAYGEMADNVISHAAPEGSPAVRAVVGYAVYETSFAFAVADLGRGVLASLRESHPIETHRSALDAAIRRGVTRRDHFNSGTGFPKLHEALADLAGVLRFRSGDSALTLDGRGASRLPRFSTSPDLPGFQLTVACEMPLVPRPSPP